MTQKTKSRALFWIRMVGWIGVGCGVPIGIFAHEFGLFTKTVTEYDELGNVISQTSTSLNGWGIISVILVGSFLTTILKEMAEAKTGYSLLKQCYVGLYKTMPLIIALAVFYFLSGVVEQALYCLTILVGCRLASIPLNPLPKWRYEKQNEENYETLTDVLTNFVKSHVKRGEK